MMGRFYKGSGTIISGGLEFPVEYEIRKNQTAGAASASGFVTGLSIGDNHAMLTSGAKALRLENGESVDIIFLGSDAPVTRTLIHVNSPMPD